MRGKGRVVSRHNKRNRKNQTHLGGSCGDSNALFTLLYSALVRCVALDCRDCVWLVACDELVVLPRPSDDY